MDMQAAYAGALLPQQMAQYPAACEGIVQMQLVDLPHQQKISFRKWTRLVIDAAPAGRQHFDLLSNRKRMLAVDNLLALRRPAFVSAPSKKSFSSGNWPNLRMERLQVHGGPGPPSPPKIPAAPSSNRPFHYMIWLACTSNCCANSAMIFSPFNAAVATFALNAAVGSTGTYAHLLYFFGHLWPKANSTSFGDRISHLLPKGFRNPPRILSCLCGCGF